MRQKPSSRLRWKLLPFSHIWHVFKQTQKCDRGDCSVQAERGAPASAFSQSISRGGQWLAFVSRAHCPRIHQLDKASAEKTSLFWRCHTTLVAEWPKCCRFINFYSPETGDKTCFGFSTQNYVRFWYYCEIRCRRGIVENLPCRAQRTAWFTVFYTSLQESIPPIYMYMRKCNYSLPA